MGICFVEVQSRNQSCGVGAQAILDGWSRSQKLTLILYGVLMMLHNYSGLVASRLSWCKVWYHLTRFAFAFWIVPAARPHTVRPDQKSREPTYKVLVRPGQEMRTHLPPGRRHAGLPASTNCFIRPSLRCIEGKCCEMHCAFLAPVVISVPIVTSYRLCFLRRVATAASHYSFDCRWLQGMERFSATPARLVMCLGLISIPNFIPKYVFSVAYLGYGRHGTCHGGHFDGGAKIAWQKLKSLFTVTLTSTLLPIHS